MKKIDPIKIMITIAMAVVSALGLGESEEDWQNYITQVRERHHFSLSTSLNQNNWAFVQSAENTKRLSYFALGKFHYAYHLRLLYDWSYFLGTSLGYGHASYGYSEGFLPDSTLMLPGLAFGISKNETTELRLSLGGQIFLERLSKISWLSRDKSQIYELHGNFITYEASLIIEYFYQIAAGIRAEIGSSFSNFERPKGSTPPEVSSTRIGRTDHFFSLGMTYHLL